MCLNDRDIIPPSSRRLVLSELHSDHLDIDKMKSLALLSCWWLGTDSSHVCLEKLWKLCAQNIRRLHNRLHCLYLMNFRKEFMLITVAPF